MSSLLNDSLTLQSMALGFKVWFTYVDAGSAEEDELLKWIPLFVVVMFVH